MLREKNATVVVALDLEHLEQLRIVWPTWQRCRPELVAAPKLAIVDCDVPGGRGRAFEWWMEALDFLGEIQVVSAQGPWLATGLPQREKMLTAFVTVVPRFVRTQYWLKIDTDAVAMHGGPWIESSWFTGEPVIVAQRWGFTRPSSRLVALDRWAQAVPWLADRPSPVSVPVPGEGKHAHPRITGWLQFTHTGWSLRYAELLAGQRLPVDSQDTFHWYCAAREQLPVVRVQHKRYGWTHVRRTSTLEQLASRALAGG